MRYVVSCLTAHHVADMNFSYCDVFWTSIRTNIQRYKLWSIPRDFFILQTGFFNPSHLPKHVFYWFFRSAYLLLLLSKMKLHRFCKPNKKKKAWQNTGAINTYTSSGLAHYLLCGDSLSTNFLLMKADCYNTSTNGALNLDNPLCIRVCIEQPLISATWTSYVYFFLHNSTPPITYRNHMESEIGVSLLLWSGFWFPLRPL